MPLIPLLPIFHRLNREFFNGSLVAGTKPMLAIRWSDARLKKTAGFYRRGPKVVGEYGAEIVLSRPLLEFLPQSAVESTLCHEMIHAWIDLVLGLEESHGSNFRLMMGLINDAQHQFQVSIRHQFPVPQTIQRWWGICPRCELRFPYQRRLKGAACRKCCNHYYGGLWHSSCLLEFEPACMEN